MVGAEIELLEKAKAEEEVYNWGEASKLYEQIAESYLDKSMVKKEVGIVRSLIKLPWRFSRTMLLPSETTMKNMAKRDQAGTLC